VAREGERGEHETGAKTTTSYLLREDRKYWKRIGEEEDRKDR
jgi:hypothetical protein